jgi:hypothetical protein
VSKKGNREDRSKGKNSKQEKKKVNKEMLMGMSVKFLKDCCLLYALERKIIIRAIKKKKKGGEGGTSTAQDEVGNCGEVDGDAFVEEETECEEEQVEETGER